MIRLVILCVLTLGLSACGSSPPTHYYTLAAVPPHQASASALTGHVAVGDVHVPATLDRQSIVLQNGPDRLTVSDQARWAAPIQGMIRRVLADDLRQRLGTELVLAPGDPLPPGPTDTVAANFQEFIGSRDGTVILDCDWSVLNRNQKVLLTHHAHLVRHVDAPNIAAIVAAQSDMLGALSDDVAKQLASSTSG